MGMYEAMCLGGPSQLDWGNSSEQNNVSASMQPMFSRRET